MHNQHEPHAAAPEASAAPPSVLVVDDDNFFDQTEGRITIIDFWAQWCAPCRAFAPIFEAASSDYLGQATFAKCDVDASPRTAALLQIQSIPTLVVFGRDGSEISRVVGGIPRRHLDAIIEQVARRTRPRRRPMTHRSVRPPPVPFGPTAAPDQAV